MTTFAHLHVHSTYSLLESTASVDALAQRAAADGIEALALTDANVLYGAVRFTAACKRAGIRPIIGMTVRVKLPPDLSGPIPLPDVAGEIVLLALDTVGYRSLCRLSSTIQTSSKTEDPLDGIAFEELREHTTGLVCVGGGRHGWVERAMRARQKQIAHRWAGRLAGIYGVSNTFLSLEIQTKADQAVALSIEHLADTLGLASVAVQPIHCMTPQETPQLRLMAAIARTIDVTVVPESCLPAFGDPRAGVHWLAPSAMTERFARFPQALATVSQIAQRCCAALPAKRDGGSPILEPTQGRSSEVALQDLALQGARVRYGDPIPDHVKERVEKEIAAIARYHYADLFLIVADAVQFARRANIPVSTRGSVANSLVAHCVGITTVDPIAHNLLFERFLSPSRTDAPDIDLDFCSRRRDEVLRYVQDRYGERHVALVSTVNTFQLRSAVRETAKAYGLDQAEIKALTDQLPRRWPPSRERRDGEQELLSHLEKQIGRPQGDDDERTGQIKEILCQASSLVGRPHHLSVHPGGLIITSVPLTDILPLQESSKDLLTTQYDHQDVEAIGLPKIDMLGVRALTVLARAEGLVRQHYDPHFRLTDIADSDEETSALLARAETVGVFQCESAGARRTLRKLRARTVRDLAIANAFFKPGPSMGGMAKTFVRRYRGDEPVVYLHPALASILEPTKGVLLFQEQILRIAREIAGLSWRQADHLRRGMSKADKDAMAEMQSAFESGCQRAPPAGPGLTPHQAHTLWKQVSAFSGYGFNQGHAMAYADVSYRCAYLKAHWPAAFLCARLAGRGGFHHPALYMVEAQRLGIAIQSPHVNYSQRGFSLTWEEDRPTIRMGLRAVRDMRGRSIETILAAGNQRPFASIRDLLARVPLSGPEADNLIACGALDGLGKSRSTMLQEAQIAREADSALQMALPFLRPGMPMESLQQRLAWEQRILGYPMSILTDPQAAAIADGRLAKPLRITPGQPREHARAVGLRLPGWTGSQGFHLWDGFTWTVVHPPDGQDRSTAWKLLWVEGQWVGDGWGTVWLRANCIRAL